MLSMTQYFEKKQAGSFSEDYKSTDKKKYKINKINYQQDFFLAFITITKKIPQNMTR